MKTLILAAALGATALAGVAIAQNTPAPQARGMQADTNGDGAISRAEFLARAEARFARVDADRNGSLTAEERRAARVAMRAPRAERGGNAGGGMGARLLARADTDQDDRISLAEFQAMARGAGRGAPAGMSAGDLAERQTQRFQRWDTNRDGYVDRSEISALGARRGGRGGMTPSAAPSPSDT